MKTEDAVSGTIATVLGAGIAVFVLALALIVSPWFWLAVIAYTLITKL